MVSAVISGGAGAAAGAGAGAVCIPWRVRAVAVGALGGAQCVGVPLGVGRSIAVLEFRFQLRNARLHLQQFLDYRVVAERRSNRGRRTCGGCSWWRGTRCAGSGRRVDCRSACRRSRVRSRSRLRCDLGRVHSLRGRNDGAPQNVRLALDRPFVLSMACNLRCCAGKCACTDDGHPEKSVHWYPISSTPVRRRVMKRCSHSRLAA